MIRPCALLVIAAVVLAACGERDAAPQASQGAAPSAAVRAEPAVAASPASLRFDGLYQSEPHDDSGSAQLHWLRFYPDGTVLEAMTGGSARAEQLGAWLDVGHPAARQQGRYELADEHVRVETRSSFSHNVSQGTLDGDGLTLEWHDRTHRAQATRRFHFVPIAAWAVTSE